MRNTCRPGTSTRKSSSASAATRARSWARLAVRMLAGDLLELRCQRCDEPDEGRACPRLVRRSGASALNPVLAKSLYHGQEQLVHVQTLGCLDEAACATDSSRNTVLGSGPAICALPSCCQPAASITWTSRAVLSLGASVSCCCSEDVTEPRASCTSISGAGGYNAHPPASSQRSANNA